jgi:hypothetical protein
VLGTSEQKEDDVTDVSTVSRSGTTRIGEGKHPYSALVFLFFFKGLYENLTRTKRT